MTTNDIATNNASPLASLRAWCQCSDLPWLLDRTEAQWRNETRLDCYRRNVQDLPEAISIMSELTWINLNFNPVASLPDAIGALDQLETLQLSEAKLTHLPESVGHLKRLSFLRIDDSGLVALPERMGDLCALTDLRLRGNRISNLPASMARLTQLQHLDLSNNPLTELPDWVGEWQHLQYLNVRGTGLTRLPASLGKLKTLRRLDCDTDKIANVPSLAFFEQFEAQPLSLLQKAFAKFFSYLGHQLPAEDVRLRRRGKIGGEDDGDYCMGDVVQYLFGQNERGEYLDFYCRHRHAGDQHWRLFEDGGMQELDLPTSWRLTSEDPAENARLQEAFYAENNRIYGLLRDKGFED